jgi:glycosyltransferase involved in cell wall biosynthesis
VSTGLSILMPVYNERATVERAIADALSAELPVESRELVVVDDGSTDGTPDVVAGYGDAVRVIRRPNGGLNAATDTGVAAARGKYLTFLDADDFWPADRLSRLAEVLDARPEVGLVYGDMDVVDCEGLQVAPSFRALYGLARVSGRVLGQLLANNAVSAGSMMVRTSLRDRFHPIGPDAAHQDWWIVTAVASVAEIAAIDTVVNHYRDHGDNMNLGAGGDRLLGLYRLELPFRRRLLTTTDLPLVSLDELVSALSVHDRLVERLAAADPAAAALAAPSDRDAALAAMDAASEALDRAALEEAGAWLVRAAAHDPVDAEPRALLSQLIPVIVAERLGAAA